MAKFNIISQFLKDISFESPNVPELFFKSDNGQAKLEINIDIQIKGAENNLFMVDLITKVHSKLENGDKSIFLIESTYSGLVQMEEEKDEEAKKRTLLIRSAHALGFEGGLVLICLPLYMIWYDVGLIKAFMMEAALLLFFLVYTFVFTLGFDKIFTLPHHYKTASTSS